MIPIEQMFNIAAIHQFGHMEYQVILGMVKTHQKQLLAELSILRFLCIHSIQKENKCNDFEVRFCCPNKNKVVLNQLTCSYNDELKTNLQVLRKSDIRNLNFKLSRISF